MADSLASRVTRILAGSAHAFLDVVEDMAPEAMMRQAVREIDQVTGEVRADLGKVEAAKHLITSQINKLNTESEQLAAHVETALNRGEDDLARAGIERQTIIDDQSPVLQRSLNEQQDKARELEGYITALLAKKREMEQALQEFIASRAGSTSPRAASGAAGTGRGRVDSAGSAFDRVMARQTGVSGLSGSVTADAAKLKELQDLQRNNRIDERLAKLKASRQK